MAVTCAWCAPCAPCQAKSWPPQFQDVSRGKMDTAGLWTSRPCSYVPTLVSLQFFRPEKPRDQQISGWHDSGLLALASLNSVWSFFWKPGSNWLLSNRAWRSCGYAIDDSSILQLVQWYLIWTWEKCSPIKNTWQVLQKSSGQQPPFES